MCVPSTSSTTWISQSQRQRGYEKSRENGYIHMDDGYITLTENGMEIAQTMYERHTVLSQWLISLGVDEKIAVEDACRMEHTMSTESFTAIKNFIIQNQA